MKGLTDKASWWLLGILAVVLQLPHSMALWGNGNYPTDICVYMRCAGWIQDGLIMYRDMFDHKGPLVYLIYWFFSFAGVYGVWLLDVAILYVVLILIYRMARLYEDEKESMLIALIMGCYWQAPFIDEGSPEWLALPGCMYSMYVGIKHYRDKEYCSTLEIILFAASVAVCLCTKPNISAVLIPIALYFTIHLLRHWNWRVFLRYTAGVVVGLAVIAVPITLWLMSQQNTQELMEAYIRFNFIAYSPTLLRRLLGFFYMTAICLPGIYCFVLITKYGHTRTWRYAFLCCLCLCSLIPTAYIKNGYPHYLIPCIPMYALLFILAWPYIKARRKLYLFTVWFMIFVGVAFMGIRSYLRLMPFEHKHTEQAAMYINHHISKDDHVAIVEPEDRTKWNALNPNYSFAYRLWLQIDAKPASSLFYLPPSISKEQREQAWEQMHERMPKYVICTQEHDSIFTSWGYTPEVRNIYKEYSILVRP